MATGSSTPHRARPLHERSPNWAVLMMLLVGALCAVAGYFVVLTVRKKR